MNRFRYYFQKRSLGPVEQKILLLLKAGVALGLSHNPNRHFRILKSVGKEWKRINERSLREAVRRLYESQLVNCKDNEDGTTSIVLSDNGQKRVLRYKLDQLKIKKPPRWDGLWRMVIFDIPEHKKRGRDALGAKLKDLNLLPIQKSVFVSPYECKDEVDFVAEIFEVKPYVRYILAKEIDIGLDLKKRFNLL